MAQLFYRYGAMNSGKSIDILKVKHNYEESGGNVLLLTSALDTRDGVGKVSSRIGLSQPAIAIKDSDDLRHVFINSSNNFNVRYDCILIDECQFLSSTQVKQLTEIVDIFKIPVIAYGLKNDFQNNLFEGSQALLTYADKIEEIKTLCGKCNRKATMNLRLSNGNAVSDGDQVQIGGNDSYIPVCRVHYNSMMEKSELA